MKNFTYFLLLCIGVFVTSCSEQENSTPKNTVDETDYFNYSAFDAPVAILSWTAVRAEDMFEVTGAIEGGSTIIFRFNSHGNLAYAMFDPNPESLYPILKSPYEFSSHYFDFTIVAVDTERKIIKVTYEGDLYEEEFNLASHSTAVAGVFNVHYTEATPEANALAVKAKIDSEMWYAVKRSVTVSGDNVKVDFNSDDDMKITFDFDSQSLVPGTYNFSNESLSKVSLSKYDVSTQSYDDFESDGTLVVTQRTSSGAGEVISGTFTFDATDPVSGLVYKVRSGTFSALVSY